MSIALVPDSTTTVRFLDAGCDPERLHAGRAAVRARVLSFRCAERRGVWVPRSRSGALLWTLERRDGTVLAVGAEDHADHTDAADGLAAVVTAVERLQVQRVHDADGARVSWWLRLDRRVVAVAPRAWSDAGWRTRGVKEVREVLHGLRELERRAWSRGGEPS